MDRYDKRGELASRDIVARAIFTQQQTGHEVYLDIRYRGKEFLTERFPNIYKELKKRGFDLAKDLIPVTPAAHYSCGGIKVDLYGRTNMANLFAFGEVSCTGVHGANRLASNSLLEAVVFPRQLEKCIAGVPKKVKEIDFDIAEVGGDIEIIMTFREKLQQLMWEKVGIMRSRKDLSSALTQLIKWGKEVGRFAKVSQPLVELKNMLLVAELIVRAAFLRDSSLGTHFIK